MKRNLVAGAIAGLLLTGATVAMPLDAAQALPYDCERSGKGPATLDLVRTVQWTERNGTWWGVGSDGVTELSNVPPWARPRFIHGKSNPDGTYTTYEYVSNYECP